MKRRLITVFPYGVTFLFYLLCTLRLDAATMQGPAIVGNVEGGGIHVIQLFADNGDEILSAADAIIQVQSTDREGHFSFENLDIDQSYFVIHNGQVSPLQRLGEIQTFIDTFDITQTITANPNTGFRINSAVGPEHMIMGGVRDFYVDVLDGSAEAQLRSNPFSRTSNLQIDMSAGVSGMVSVTWDGVRGGMEPDTAMSMDLTHGGMYTGISLRLAVDRAGDGQYVKLKLHSHDGVSEKEIAFPVTPSVSPADLTYIPFDAFAGDADPTQVSAIQLMVEKSMPSLDARISGIGLTGPSPVSFPVLPEPSTSVMLLMGLGAMRCIVGSMHPRLKP